MPNEYLKYLQEVVDEDVRVLCEKEESYGDSWMKRGGIGAYFVMIRKYDRLDTVMPRFGYDIFKAIESDTREEGILDDVQDLRRYLTLIEAQIRVRGNIPSKPQTTIASTVLISQEELKKNSSYTKSVTPGGIRNIPRNPVETIPKPIHKSTEMESPFGYAPDLDDLNDLDNP